MFSGRSAIQIQIIMNPILKTGVPIDPGLKVRNFLWLDP